MLREAVHGSWRQFIVFATIPAILCFALVFCFIPESPRFLASKGRYREAKDCIKRIEAINGNESRALRKKYTTVDTVSEHSSQLIKSSTRSAFGSLWDPALRKTTIVLMMSWFCLSFGKVDQSIQSILSHFLRLIRYCNLDNCDIYSRWTLRRFCEC